MQIKIKFLLILYEKSFCLNRREPSGDKLASKVISNLKQINPNINTQIAYNVQSKIIETVRTNGVLLTQVTPQGGIISGQSSVMYLGGWNWEDATCKPNDGIHLRWPSSYYNTGWWGEPGGREKNKKY